MLDWVLMWACTIALLRAVGLILIKEGAKRDARLENARGAWWAKLNATKPDPTIFWEFIERDRNLFLKEAKLTSEPMEAPMGRVRVAGFGVSIDGFGAGPPSPARTSDPVRQPTRRLAPTMRKATTNGPMTA